MPTFIELKEHRSGKNGTWNWPSSGEKLFIGFSGNRDLANGLCKGGMSDFFAADLRRKSADQKKTAFGNFFCCASGRARSLGGESPLNTRQGEVLAERQGCPLRGGIWKKL